MDHAVLGNAVKAQIVFVPMDRFDFGLMRSKDVLRRVVARIGLKHLNDIVVGHRKQMTPVSELYFLAHLDLDFLHYHKVVFIDVHHPDFVRESYY